jgi:hypothetical protein
MADSRQDWLESELARQMRPVAAPEELWARIHEQRRPLRVRRNLWGAWSIVAASVVMLLAGLVWRLGAARSPAVTARHPQVMLMPAAQRQIQGDCLLCHAQMPAVMVIR